MNLTIRTLELGELQTNCYIIEGEEGHCVVVDPGDESIKLVKTIQDFNLTVEAILVTHCHFDHIGAVTATAKKFGVEIYAHAAETEKMKDPEANLSAFYGLNPAVVIATRFIEHNQTLDFGYGLEFLCLEVPGHTENSMCFYHSSGHVITGDTLFNDSVGRTDLYSGSPMDLVINIKKVLFALPVATKVYPGHGLSTTIGREMQYNPYFIH